MKIVRKLGLPLVIVSLSALLMSPVANAKEIEHNGAPKALKGTWVSRVTKIPADLRPKGADYQRTIWYVGNHGTDENGLFYKNNTNPAKFFNGGGGGGANSHLKYVQRGTTYYLNSNGGTNYFHYKVKVLNHQQIQLYANYHKQATKWHYLGKYHKQSNHIITFTKQTKINY